MGFKCEEKLTNMMGGVERRGAAIKRGWIEIGEAPV